MDKINILHIGIKYWPHIDEVINDTSLTGKRGGGMNKYCDMLINNLPPDVNTIIICQRLKGQLKKEIIGNTTVYRTWTFGNRANRQIIANILSFIITFKVILQKEINIFHGHMQPGIFIAYLLGKLFNKPTVGTPYSFTSIEQKLFYNRISKYVEKTYYKKLDILVFESNENRIKAEEYMKINFSNSIVINTGISIPREINSAQIKSKINIIYLGRLVKIKAINNLILSVLYMNTNVKLRIHINIVGEGELYESLRNLIISNNLSEFITLHGYVENSNEAFRNNDIFILPSYQEGLSIALLEAMSYGLACIVNNYGVPFNKDVVLEMENNLPETIAKSITYLTENINVMDKLKKASRNEIINNYSIAKFVNEYYLIYCNLFNKKKFLKN